MEKRLVIANWKSHKTTKEARDFLENFKEKLNSINFSNKEVVLAPSFVSLMLCREFIDNNSLPLKLCAQNVSSYPEGAYTGEVSAKQIKEFADYVIVGHSERKRYLNENENDVDSKIKEAKDQGLIVIQCIQDENSQIHDDADIVAYEPPNAISTFGNTPETPEEIKKVFDSIKDRLNGRKLLYGGSVDKSNIKSYEEIEFCGGFLIGSASLTSQSFIDLLQKW